MNIALKAGMGGRIRRAFLGLVLTGLGTGISTPAAQPPKTNGLRFLAGLLFVAV